MNKPKLTFYFAITDLWGSDRAVMAGGNGKIFYKSDVRNA